MIKIVTDSTADIPQEIAAELGLTIVPLSVAIDGETYRDGVDMTSAEFIDTMAAAKDLPKSSQPAVGAFVETFNELGKDGAEVLSIHLTDKMSGTYNSAAAAAELSDAKVTVHNSKYISHALGFQVREALELAKKGLRIEEIREKLEEIREKTHLYIVVDKLDNLVKGGRIGRGTAFIGGLLNIKPIATLANGEYTPVAKVRSYSQVIKFLAKQIAEDVKGKTIKRVGIAHANAMEHVDQLCDAVKDLIGKDKIDITFTTPVISTHTGAGALALMYVTD